ncbi:MAG: primosomal protein N' [Rhodospirillales bacterium]|nr:primosomal protein N' [Rhodospirillales bacterium]
MNSGRKPPTALLPSDRADATVEVLLPLPLYGTFEYRAGDGGPLSGGRFVQVPLGNRQAIGAVWGAGSESVAGDKLKTITRAFDAPPLPPVSRRFIEWVAAYTVHPPGAVLRMAMSVPAALTPPSPNAAVTMASDPPDIRWTAERRRVVEAAEGLPRPAAELARTAGVGPGVVAGLVKAGVLVQTALPAGVIEAPDPDRPGVALTPSQAAAAGALRDAARRGYSVNVLDGVAGSGKTEVYFEAVAETLRQGRQALVLLPEIALGAQWLDRFRLRFGAEPAEWHSELGHGYRRRTWRAVAEGAAPVVVGARSALFLPFPNLGLIVVDEEHDTSFKQEDGVAYNARDMAVVRARLGDIPAVLVSATPSLETIVNAQAGRYHRIHLPDRHGTAASPPIEVVDLRRDRPPRGGWLSPPLRAALAETVGRQTQALLFLNRRGYAPLTLCRACGHRIQCPNCTTWLVEHRLLARLQCHHCGHSQPIPVVCPNCRASDSLAGCGPGVERLADEVASLLPDARLALATSDTLTGPAAATELVRRMEAHEIDVVVGTQIVAKGYHFPLLTLVGVVDADLGLSGGDLRAAERTWQLLVQVAGRAGRAAHPGRVILQTHMPEHPVIAALAGGDREAFLAAETSARRSAGLPPFGRLAALIVSDRIEANADRAARLLARQAPQHAGVRVLGPAPAPLAVLRGRHRRRLLVMATKEVAVPALVRRWLEATPLPRSVRIQVDVDPYSFL